MTCVRPAREENNAFLERCTGHRAFEKGDNMIKGNWGSAGVQRPGDIMGQPGRPQQGRAMPKEMPKERLTEDLLARLLASESPESYLAQGETIDRELPDYLYSLLDANGMNRSQVARTSCINTTFLYNIFEGKSKPKRDNALMLAFALACDLRQTQRLLRLADVAELWPKVRRDAVIIWCIEHGYTREECDDELYRLGERVIFKVTSELR